MTTFYIDVSHYDWDRNNGNLDWNTIKSNGINVTFIRATYGDPSIYNPETRYFVEMAREAKKAGLNVGGYHNLIRGDLNSIQRQVTYFIEQLNLANAEYAMLDVEPYQALVDNGLWPRLSDAELFAQEFTKQTDRRLAIYLPQWVWSSYLTKADLTNLVTVAKGPLVSSNYPMKDTRASYRALYDQSTGDNGPGWLPYGGVTPRIWQYSSNSMVPGASSTTDINSFKGTNEELQTLLGRDDAMAWVLTKELDAFRTQMNKAFPHRDKASDGTVGDLAHQNESASGHNPDLTGAAEYKDGDSKNEVRAIDIDSDTGDPDVSMEDIVQHLLRLARAGKLSVIRYMIYNRRIWSASNGWAQAAYTGASAHTEHLHLSGAYNQAADENATFDYHLDELVDNMDQAEFTAFYLNAIKDDTVQALQKARPWQYVGGGIPAGMSTLNVFNSIYVMVSALAAAIANEGTSPAELQAALDQIPTAEENAAAVIEELGGADINDVAETLKTVLGPDKIAALKAVL